MYFLDGGSLKSEVICSITWLLKLFRWLASFCCSVFDVKNMVEKLPVLGVCYGAQLTAKLFGGRVDKSEKREYGRASLKIENHEGDALFKNVTGGNNIAIGTSSLYNN